MQRQQEHDEQRIEGKPKRRRGRRSVGTMLAAGLLLLWGCFSTCLILALPMALSMIIYYFGIFFWLFLLQGILSLTTGVLTLRGHTLLAPWFLLGAALCLVGLAAVVLFGPPDQMFKDSLPIVFLSLAAILFFLGRWLGHQEDTEV